MFYDPRQHQESLSSHPSPSPPLTPTPPPLTPPPRTQPPYPRFILISHMIFSVLLGGLLGFLNMSTTVKYVRVYSIFCSKQSAIGWNEIYNRCGSRIYERKSDSLSIFTFGPLSPVNVVTLNIVISKIHNQMWKIRIKKSLPSQNYLQNSIFA